MRRACLSFIVVLLACRSSSSTSGEAEQARASEAQPAEAPKAEAEQPEVVPPAPAAPAPEPEQPAVAKPATLLIAGEQGLREVDLDGKPVRTLVEGPSAAPRVLPDGTILFLRPKDGHLELVSLAAEGGPRAIATIPTAWDPKACGARLGDHADEFEQLSLQVPSDFSVDLASGKACLSLQDRNDNMVDVGVTIRVELATGKLTQNGEIDLPGNCAEGSGHVCGKYPLAGEPEPAASPSASFAWDFVFDEHAEPIAKLVPREGPPLVPCRDDACASEESRSQSGRFVLLGGRMLEGDYIYRELVLFDRSDGSLWAIVDPYGSPRLTQVQVKDLMVEDHEWYAAPGEADIRWLAGDRLWIEGMLIDPAARKIHAVEGELAYRIGKPA